MNQFKTPFEKLIAWLALESETPYHAVLATATRQGIPHSRIVAIREISPDGILFFTQRHTRKEQELTENPHASMTFWCAKQHREIILDGPVKSLTSQENQSYWQTMSRERQLRFTTYAEHSTQPINSLFELETKQQQFADKYANQDIPMSEFYCGFRLQPEVFYFYTVGQDTFSEYVRVRLENNIWVEQLLSP